MSKHKKRKVKLSQDQILTTIDILRDGVDKQMDIIFKLEKHADLIDEVWFARGKIKRILNIICILKNSLETRQD